VIPSKLIHRYLGLLVTVVLLLETQQQLLDDAFGGLVNGIFVSSDNVPLGMRTLLAYSIHHGLGR
jgi:hypothetical protein